MKTLIRVRTLHSISRRTLALVTILSLFALFPWPVRTSNAATIVTARMYLNRQQAGITTGAQYELFFIAPTGVAGGAGVNKVIFSFPSNAANNTKWCVTPGTGDLAVTGITNPSGGTTTEAATTLPGTTKTAACAQSPDTFTISGVDNLVGGTKYGVRVAQVTSTVIGTGDAANDIQVTVKANNGSSDIDTGTLALSLIASDQVAVSASVNPTLTVVLAGAPVNLGVLTTSNVSYKGITSTVTTNASGGYLSLVKYNNTLTSGLDTIANAGGTITNGTAGYGAVTSQAGRAIAQDTSSTPCDTTLRTQVATVNATTLTTTFQDFATAAAPVSSQATTLCFLAAVGGTTPAGSYTSTSTLVTTARF